MDIWRSSYLVLRSTPVVLTARQDWKVDRVVVVIGDMGPRTPAKLLGRGRLVSVGGLGGKGACVGVGVRVRVREMARAGGGLRG